MTVIFYWLTYVLTKLAYSKVYVWSSKDHSIYYISYLLLVVRIIDCFIKLRRKSNCLVIRQWNDLQLILLIHNPEFLQNRIQVLFLVQVQRPILPVSSNSSAQNLADLPQALGIESTRELFSEPLYSSLFSRSYEYIVHVYKKIDFLLIINE